MVNVSEQAGALARVQLPNRTNIQGHTSHESILSYLYLHTLVNVIRIMNTSAIWPEIQTVMEGGRASISCTSDTSPTWTHNDIPLTRNIEGNSVVIASITMAQAGVYKCNGTKRDGSGSEATSIIVVVVVDNSRITPTLIKCKPGETVEFNCDSNSPATWSYESGPLPRNAMSPSNNKLRLNRILFANDGKYECLGTYEKEYQKFIAKGELRVLYQGLIMPQKLKIYENDVGSIFCRSATLPFWLHNDNASLPFNIVPDKHHFLSIIGAKWVNRGFYECIGTTKHRTTFSALSEVTVLVKDNGKITPRYKTVYLGQTVSFSCTSDEQVNWTFNKDPLPHDVQEGHPSTTDLYWITIESTQWVNRGKYVCEGADHKFNYTFFAEGFLDIYTKKCQMPILSNGKIVLLNNTIGAIATYKCFDGFTLTGPHITQCLSTGQWSSLRPQCRHLSTHSRCKKKYLHFILFISLLQVTA